YLEGHSTYNDFSNSSSFDVLKNSTNSTITLSSNSVFIGENVTISGHIDNHTGVDFVNVTVDGNRHTVPVDSSGNWNLTYTTNRSSVVSSSLGASNNIPVVVSYVGNDNLTSFINKTSFIVKKRDLNVSVDIPKGDVGDEINITIRLNGSVNTTTDVVIGNTTYKDVKFVDGVAKIPYKIKDPAEKITVSVKSNDYFNGVTVTQSVSFKGTPKVKTKVTKATQGKSVTLKATLLDNHNKPLANKLVKFYLNGKYIGQAKTNSKGVASLKYTPKKAGNYKYTVKFEGDNLYHAVKGVSILKVKKDTNNNGGGNNGGGNNGGGNNGSANMKKSGIPLILVLVLISTIFGIGIRRKKE
ncbi:MAG: Ig-like domain-containing protein, partial [Methanobrevibacter sp.]|nr:Ig-like domain-containing protein [Methanobrevibacter sp.]